MSQPHNDGFRHKKKSLLVQDVVLSANGQTIVADFGLHGLQVFDSTWTTLSPFDPDQIVVV